MATALFANAIGNRAARRRAELMAVPQWRFVSLGQTILSNTRIMFWQGKWLQFGHSVIVCILPDIPNYCLSLEY